MFGVIYWGIVYIGNEWSYLVTAVVCHTVFEMLFGKRIITMAGVFHVVADIVVVLHACRLCNTLLAMSVGGNIYTLGPFSFVKGCRYRNLISFYFALLSSVKGINERNPIEYSSFWCVYSLLWMSDSCLCVSCVRMVSLKHIIYNLATD